MDAGGFVFATNVLYAGTNVNGFSRGLWPHASKMPNVHNQSMTPASHYECSLVQADGEFDLERFEREGRMGDAKDLFHGGANTRFSDATNPNSRWWDGTSSGLSITNISNNGPVMTFIT